MRQVIKIGETPLDLDTNTIISTTKRVANIGTLERQSSFTNKLNLPTTANNLAAIGMVQGSDDSTKKYIKQTGSVYANGIEIMNAAQFSFESLSDRIELLINSDNAVFFDAIKKTLINDIDMADLDHLWSKTEMINSINNDFNDGYIYGIHDSGYQSQFTSSLNCYGIVPSIFVKYLFQKIGETFGYTFTGDIFNTSYFENLVMPVIGCNVGERNIEELKCSYITNVPYTMTNAFQSRIYDYYNIVKGTDGNVFSDKWNVNPDGNIYYFHIPGNYRVTLDYDFSLIPEDPNGEIYVAAELVIKAYQELNAVTTLMGEVAIQKGDEVGNYTGQLVLDIPFESFIETTLNPNTNGSENTEVKVYVDYRYGGADYFNPIYFVINYLSFNIEEITSAKVSHYNRLYNVQESLPKWTCGKFLKEISNLFGIIPIVNEYDKTIRLMLFNELNANKTIAKNWQSKIDLANDPVYTFKIDGYGQLNTFQYLPDSTFGYSINIVNESLPKEVAYIKSEFNYSTFSRLLNKNFNTIFLNNYDPEIQITSNFTYKNMMKFNGKVRVAFLFRQNTQVIYSSFGESNVSQNTNIPFLGFETQSFQTFSLDWNYLYETFYKSLFQGITNNILKIELTFRLTEFDIQDFDFSIPVYLENPSGYYYVQEIKDFTSSSESTSVELLRIG
jgi:hypothetical protein